LKGDFAAVRLIVDRLDPKPRGRPIALDIPDDIPMPQRFTMVSRAMLRGEITPDEAKVMVAVLEAEDAAHRRGNDYQARLAMHPRTLAMSQPESAGSPRPGASPPPRPPTSTCIPPAIQARIPFPLPTGERVRVRGPSTQVRASPRLADPL